MKLEWKVYRSINSFDKKAWDRYIGSANPFSKAAFMEITEAIHPQDRFFYLSCHDAQGTLVAIAFYYVAPFDLLQAVASKPVVKGIRRLWPGLLKLSVGMTATWETYGQHFWYDESKTDRSTLAAALLETIRTQCGPHTIVVWRDYLATETNEPLTNALAVNKTLGFTNAASLPISKITIKPNIQEADYFYEIKKKHRIYMRKILAEREEQGLRVEWENNFLPLLPTLYPLYRNVHQNAKEYQTPALPLLFFEQVKHQYTDAAAVLLVKDKAGHILAFVLLVIQEGVLNPFLIGMDYSKRNYNLWYHCTWESILYAIRNGCSSIDLGATNYGMKEKLGAHQVSNTISLRFRNRILNRLLGKLLVSFAK